MGAEIWDFGFTVSYQGESTNPNVSIVGGTPEYPANNTHYVGLGRNLSELDVRTARRVMVIGHAIAQRLFPFVDPIDRDVLVDGRRVPLEKETQEILARVVRSLVGDPRELSGGPVIELRIHGGTS